jgi:hypothetical protein
MGLPSVVNRVTGRTMRTKYDQWSIAPSRIADRTKRRDGSLLLTRDEAGAAAAYGCNGVPPDLYSV